MNITSSKALNPRLSVLVPNFNYSSYIGETIQSVLDSAGPDIEIAVCDNASTDNSVEVVRGFNDPRIQIEVNPFNVGFGPNLQRVASMATGRRMLLLSSDDRMRPEAIPAYLNLEDALGSDAEFAIWGSSAYVIDSEGVQTGVKHPDAKVWSEATVDSALSAKVGYPVRACSASVILRRALHFLRTALPFATTCYSKSLHDAVGGYAGGRLVNPDKWFLWKILSKAKMVYSIDHPLFDYRVHNANQLSQERKAGALKHLTDQYVSTFDLPDSVLSAAQIKREDLSKAFIENDIVLRGLVSLSEGQRFNARRSIHFGLAAYPSLARQNKKFWLLRALTALGPMGTQLAQMGRDRIQKKWQDQHTSDGGGYEAQ